jgi:hypothetical protein
MVTAGTLVSPMRASALGVPAPEKSYAAFFLGQGGYWWRKGFGGQGCTLFGDFDGYSRRVAYRHPNSDADQGGGHETRSHISLASIQVSISASGRQDENENDDNRHGRQTKTEETILAGG